MESKRRFAHGRGALVVLAGAGVLLAFGVAIAVAGIPDGAGVIHACYKQENGQTRIVESAVDCGPNEIPIQWSQTGPQGATGATGPTGPTGATGATGAEGSALGYAYVAQNGTLINSKGVDQVTHPETGVWCFGLGFKAHVAVATVTGFAGLGNQIVHTSIASGAGDACTGPNPADAAAYMVLPDGTRTDYQFFIEFN
jgi:hypothetical protein